MNTQELYILLDEDGEILPSTLSFAESHSWHRVWGGGGNLSDFILSCKQEGYQVKQVELSIVEG